MKFQNKKLLVLGGKPIGSCEIVEYAQKEGAYVIVTDYLHKNESAAKRIANESWEISTADLDTLCKKIQENSVDGVYTGVHEFNINSMLHICQRLNLPCYCTDRQWENVDNKEKFKNMCRKYGVPVTEQFDDLRLDDALYEVEYPVIVKPVDGSGSRGFSICNNIDELKIAVEKAKEFSVSKKVLVEKFMDYKNSVIINYTICDGKVYFSGIGDKHSKKVTEEGAPIMSTVIYPSLYEKEYLENLNTKVEKMFVSEGYVNGPIWIEAFCDSGKFTFNEMGYRFGGSLTYYPVEYLTGIKQLETQVDYAILGRNEPIRCNYHHCNNIYMVLPVHVRPGIIKRIEGIEELSRMKELKHIVYVHFLNDEIKNWGSAQQVFAYIHFTAENRVEADKIARYVVNTLKVFDEDNNQLLFNLYI